MTTARSRTYQLRVALTGAKPPIWRRFLVSPTTSLAELHDVLQIVMGWDNYHLHHFRQGERRYAPPSPWDDDGFCPSTRRSVSRRASRASGVARRRTAVACGATTR
ncbi:plasmid pRiA4b ORF-3 family protein [Candidatus Palauibacter sp.]|uniref:plasmid pRiA4b ORF-3 family protein n=1 Tax=Candidatus Palauibacter sp. TaxID=3101350 RepID=UPI003D0BC975